MLSQNEIVLQSRSCEIELIFLLFQCVTPTIPHLLLCQASVPYPTISGRTDDSAA